MGTANVQFCEPVDVIPVHAPHIFVTGFNKKKEEKEKGGGEKKKKKKKKKGSE